MVGYPKYQYGDTIVFKINSWVSSGVITVIDAYGTFFDNSDIYYDIRNKEFNTLFKHIPEQCILRKIEDVDLEAL